MNLENRANKSCQSCRELSYPRPTLTHGGLSRKEEVVIGILTLVVVVLLGPVLFYFDERGLARQDKTPLKEKIKLILEEIKIIWNDYLGYF